MLSTRFGIEIEFTGITREQAGRVAAEFLGGTVNHYGHTYDAYRVTAPDGRVWQFVSDSSILCQRKEHGQIITLDAHDAYARTFRVELVSPILTYREDIKTLQGLVRCLRKAGGFTNNTCGIHVHLDGAKHTSQSLRNFVNLIASRNDLFYKALQIPDERQRYCNFVTALAEMAKTQTRILDKPYTDDNDKFAMRLFLVRLGLKGEQHKRTRTLLMQNLSGNTAWRSGNPPADREARRALRRFPSRATVQHLKSAYPAGLRVQLVPMDEANTTMPQIRARGTVVGVDDAGSVFVSWDNGSGVGLAFSAEHDEREADEK